MHKRWHIHVMKLYIFVMQTSNIEHRYRATISPFPTLAFSRLSVESPGHDDNLHSHRRRRFIFPLSLRWGKFRTAKFYGRISARKKYPRARTTQSFSHPFVTNPRKVRTRVVIVEKFTRPVANFSQRVQSGISPRLA